MKICITAQENNLESPVDPRFGRCKYFIIVDPDTLQFQALANESLDATGGAGIKSGQLMAENGVGAVLTGNVGPNAFSTLQAAGINIIVGVTGTVRQAIEKYKKQEFKVTNSPSVKSKFGMS